MTELRATCEEPFKEWEDWIGTKENGETIVVTFETMKYRLFEEWLDQAVTFNDGERVVNHDNFDYEEAKEWVRPGAYKDDFAEDCYTITIPGEFMSLKRCREWIENLNNKYGTDFELVDPEEEKLFDVLGPDK